MQIPIIPHRGKIKPRGSIPRLNREHPLTRGLVFYAYDMGFQYVDLVQGGVTQTVTSTNRVTRGTSHIGAGVNWPGTSTSDGLFIPLAGADYRVKTFAQAAPYTVAMGSVGTAIGVSNNYITCLGDTTTGGDSLGFAANSGGTNIVLLSDNGAGGSAFTNAFSASTYQTHMVVATGASAATLYYNGKQDTTTAVAMTTSGSSSLQVILNSNSAGTAGFGGGISGFVHYWAGWNRVLTATEAFQLHADPWCFLIYPEDEMMAGLVGAISGVKFRKTLSLYGSGAGKRQGILS